MSSGEVSIDRAASDTLTPGAASPNRGWQKRTLKFWIDAARSVALGQSLIPFIAGILLALKHPVASEWFTWPLVALALIGVACAHLGINLLDDYFDYKKGDVTVRQNLIDGGMRARSKKCWYIEEGRATLAETRRAAIVFLAVALAIGILASVLRGPLIPLIVLVGLVLGIEYSGPPLRFSYHGLGELAIGIIFGPLVLVGAYCIASGEFAPVALFAALPTGFLVINIVYTHAIMDFESDKDARRITLAVLLKTKPRALVLLFIIVALVYVCLAVGIIMGAFPLATLACLVTLPLALAFCQSMWLYVYKPETSIKPRWWMGPLGNWAAYEAAGMGWFMIRWLTARNLVLFFLFALSVSYLLG